MKKVVFLFTVLLFPIYVIAGCKKVCTAKYFMPGHDEVKDYGSGGYSAPVINTVYDSWSTAYHVTGFFYSGQELNDFYNSYDFHPYDIVCIIYWSNGGLSVITLFETTSSDKLSSSELNNYSEVEGIDKHGTKWRIEFN